MHGLAFLMAATVLYCKEEHYNLAFLWFDRGSIVYYLVCEPRASLSSAFVELSEFPFQNSFESNESNRSLLDLKF
jgi:hypothetical protein